MVCTNIKTLKFLVSHYATTAKRNSIRCDDYKIIDERVQGNV